MLKLTLVEDGKPIVGIGIEYDDWKKLKDEKKTWCFEVGGQQVHIGYIESKEKLQEKIKKGGLMAKITADPEPQQKEDFGTNINVNPGEKETPKA